MSHSRSHSPRVGGSPLFGLGATDDLAHYAHSGFVDPPVLSGGAVIGAMYPPSSLTEAMPGSYGNGGLVPMSMPTPLVPREVEFLILEGPTPPIGRMIGTYSSRRV